MPALIINGGDQIAFENGGGRISDFQVLVTLTLTLDWVIRHTVMHHSSTSTYTPNVIEIEETFCERDGRTDVRTGGRTLETDCIRSTRRSRPNKTSALFRRHCFLLGNNALNFYQEKTPDHEFYSAMYANAVNDKSVGRNKLVGSLNEVGDDLTIQRTALITSTLAPCISRQRTALDWPRAVALCNAVLPCYKHIATGAMHASYWHCVVNRA